MLTFIRSNQNPHPFDSAQGRLCRSKLRSDKGGATCKGSIRDNNWGTLLKGVGIKCRKRSAQPI